MKNKFKLFTGISFGVSLCAATSIPLTMTFKDYNHSIVKPIVPENKYEPPILKDNITFAGTINQLIKSDGRSEDVNSNLDVIFNGNKKALIENYDKVNQSDFESLQFSSEILGWNNWGDLTFNQWKNQNQQENQKQQIQEIQYTNEEMINFISKDQLKSYLGTNLNTILGESYQNAKLANVDFGVNDNGDLLIPIITTTSPSTPTTKLYSVANTQTEQPTSKLVLKISSDKITFTPQIKVAGSYGDDEDKTEIQSKEITFDCEIINEKTQYVTFAMQAAYKNEITLKDKGVNGNQILLYDTIKDEDIYKALGWLDDNSSLDNHVDGQDMDISLLNEDIIYSDLGINKLTDELLGIKLDFINGENSRKVNDTNYNGEYKITIETIDISNKYDISLKLKTYEVVSAINQKNKTNSPLQLLVPNAYLLDTSLENGNYMYITGSYLGYEQPFEMGFKAENGEQDFGGDKFIDKNLKNEIICQSFMKKINDAIKSKSLQIYNELIFEYSNTIWVKDMKPYGNVIIFNVKLKKGFTFKNKFTMTFDNKTYNFNFINKKSNASISFGVDTVNTNSETGVIWKNSTKTATQVANDISSSGGSNQTY